MPQHHHYISHPSLLQFNSYSVGLVKAAILCADEYAINPLRDYLNFCQIVECDMKLLICKTTETLQITVLGNTTANVNRYQKLRKAFSKFYRRQHELVSKLNVGLKSLLLQGLSEPQY